MIPKLRGGDRIRKQTAEPEGFFRNVARQMSPQRCRAYLPALLETGETLPR